MRNSRAIILSVTVFLVDRAFKFYSQSLPNGTVFSLFPGFKFGYYLNPTLFFFPPWRFIPWLALAVLVTVLGLWIWNLFRVSDLGSRVLSHQTLLPIIFGGTSNIFDRFIYHGVIDYVNIWGLATFNLADILILLGILLLAYSPLPKVPVRTLQSELGIKN